MNQHKIAKELANVGVDKALSYFIGRGVPVAIPVQGKRPYDFVIENEGLRRIQVRVSSYRLPNGIHQVTLKGKNNETFNPEETDYLFVVCNDGSEYLIPTSNISTRTTLDLGPKYAPFRIAEGAE